MKPDAIATSSLGAVRRGTPDMRILTQHEAEQVERRRLA